MKMNSGKIVEVKEGAFKGSQGEVWPDDQTPEMTKAGKVIVRIDGKKILKDAKKLKHIGFFD